jgi:dTDP-4-dehydrorhamnose reductase
MRVLVTGAGGLLAAAIVREFAAAAAAVVALQKADLDLTHPEQVRKTVGEVRPDLVVNCAAFNDVDGAEDNAPAALALNAFAVRTLARAASDAGSGIVHYSTDFVFDGEQSRPYVEDDPPNPRSAYAASKLLGEWFALEHPGAYVLRVESLFGQPGPGGSRTGSLDGILRRIRARESMPVFVDRTITPGYTTDIASATRELAMRRAAPGLYHCVNDGATTWAEIAKEAARLLDLPLHMTPVTLESVALRARRPKYSALSTGKLAAAGIAMPAWQDALRRHLAREMGGSPHRIDGSPDRIDGSPDRPGDRE